MFTGFSSKETSKIFLEDFNDFFNFLGILETETQNQKTFKKSHTFYNQKTTVNINTNSKGKTRVNFTYSFNPNFLSWLIGVCFFPFGFLIFIIPNKEKDEFEVLINTYDF